MALKQKNQASNSKTTNPSTKLPKDLPIRTESSSSKSNPAATAKSKTWDSLSAAEKIEFANRAFISTSAWKGWSEVLKRDFLKSVESGKTPNSAYSWSATLEDPKRDLSGTERDAQGRRLVDLSREELEIYREKERELLQLSKESWGFRERAFVLRKRRELRSLRTNKVEAVKVGETTREGNQEEDSEEIPETEIEEEKTRRRKMAALEGRREGSVGRYSSDPAWDDVVPLVQIEDAGALASIAYSEEYAEAISYLRAVMATSEHSPRIMALTSHVISLNASHYTVWLYRAKTLFALGWDLYPELEWLNTVALANQKNYQIWHHRQLILSHLYPKPESNPFTGDIEGKEDDGMKKKEELLENETAFMAKMLSKDSKNYHVWSYRQWLVRYFNLFSSPTELSYTETLVMQDLRNNSAYSHRFFVVFSNPEYCTIEGCGPTETDPKLSSGTTGKEVVQREIEWAKGWIYLAPGNASSWGYLRGVLRKGGIALGTLSDLASNFVDLGSDEPESDPDSKNKETETEDVNVASQLQNHLWGTPSAKKKGEEDIKSSQALEFLADVWEEEASEDAQKKADKAFRLLGDKYDVVRRNYWEWRRESLNS